MITRAVVGCFTAWVADGRAMMTSTAGDVELLVSDAGTASAD